MLETLILKKRDELDAVASEVAKLIRQNRRVFEEEREADVKKEVFEDIFFRICRINNEIAMFRFSNLEKNTYLSFVRVKKYTISELEAYVLENIKEIIILVKANYSKVLAEDTKDIIKSIINKLKEDVYFELFEDVGIIEEVRELAEQITIRSFIENHPKFSEIEAIYDIFSCIIFSSINIKDDKMVEICGLISLLNDLENILSQEYFVFKGQENLIRALLDYIYDSRLVKELLEKY